MTACVDTFTKVQNRNAHGGRRLADVESEEGCRAACLALPFSECGAFDYNRANNGCYLHRLELQNLNPANNVVHSTRVKCIGRSREKQLNKATNLLSGKYRS